MVRSQQAAFPRQRAGSDERFHHGYGAKAREGFETFHRRSEPNGGSMFRIYRDVRFAKDKRPYKEHAACHFRHALGKDAHAPGFYMHFSPSEVFFGGGLWMPPPDALTKIREGIRGGNPRGGSNCSRINPSQNISAACAARRSSVRHAGSLRNIPSSKTSRGRASTRCARRSPKLATSPELVDEVSVTFAALSPLMKFLCAQSVCRTDAALRQAQGEVEILMLSLSSMRLSNSQQLRRLDLRLRKH